MGALRVYHCAAALISDFYGIQTEITGDSTYHSNKGPGSSFSKLRLRSSRSSKSGCQSTFSRSRGVHGVQHQIVTYGMLRQMRADNEKR